MSFRNQFRGGLPGFVAVNSVRLTFAVVWLVMAVGTGGLAAKLLPAAAASQLQADLQHFAVAVGAGHAALPGSVLFHQQVAQYLSTAAWVWVLGLSVVGAPLAAGILFVRGFGLGFTVAFLIRALGGRGLALAAAATAVPSLLLLPALLLLVTAALSFSAAALHHHGERRFDGEDVVAYSFVGLLGAAGLVGAAWLAATVAPLLMRVATHG